MTPVQNMRVRWCRAQSSVCSPIGDEMTTGDSGSVTVRVQGVPAQGFTDYLELTHPEDKYRPTLVYVAPPARAKTIVSVAVFKSDIARSLMLGPGVADASRGSLVVHALDCGRNEAAGVKLAVSPSVTDDAQVTEFYMKSSVPLSVTAGATMTDDVTAFGGFLGLPAQSYSLSGHAPVKDDSLAEAFSAAVWVRAGTVTFVEFAAGR